MGSDRLETIGQTRVQHGPLNDRVYLMHLDPADYPSIVDQVDTLAEKEGYSKIFAKVPEWAASGFLERGYVQEASIPLFFRDGGNLLFLSRFLDPERYQGQDLAQVREVLAVAREKGKSAGTRSSDLQIREMTSKDAEAMAGLYRMVFDSYPFPIFDPEYIRETMRTHIRYFGVQENGTLCGLGSAEMDLEHNASEMTDFATSPSHRGRGMAGAILKHMEEAIRSVGIRTCYTIARAVSPGMNIVFAKAGYCFGGTLVKNTNIGGSLESMNVWYRP